MTIKSIILTLYVGGTVALACLGYPIAALAVGVGWPLYVLLYLVNQQSLLIARQTEAITEIWEFVLTHIKSALGENDTQMFDVEKLIEELEQLRKERE